MNDINMKQLLALMCLVDWLANDLHYRSRGRGFYEKHLLADRVRDLGDDDAIKEAYWLGFRKQNPPADAEIAGMAVVAYNKMSKYDSLQALCNAFGLVTDIVEECKREQGLPAGVHAILDGISEKALTYGFLVRSYTAQD